jgi:hypothetical protein
MEFERRRKLILRLGSDGREGGLGSELFRRIEGPKSLRFAGPSTLRSLFHPNAKRVSGLRCTLVSEILILG